LLDVLVNSLLVGPPTFLESSAFYSKFLACSEFVTERFALQILIGYCHDMLFVVVCLSVTRVYCDKTTEVRITVFLL